MRLTKTVVEKLPIPPANYAIVWDSDLQGFGCKVLASGRRIYVAQRRVNGRSVRITVGRHGEITADEARRNATLALARMTAGGNPVKEKRAARLAATTLAEIATDYSENRRRKSDGKPLKSSFRAEIARHLDTSFKDWSGQPVNTITRDMVRRRYLQLAKRSPAQANQAMRILRALLNYAMETCRTEDDRALIPENPVRILSGQSLWHGDNERSQHYIRPEHLGVWWLALSTRRQSPGLRSGGRTALDFVAVLALTGLRRSEAAALRWDQVHLDKDEAWLELADEDTKNRLPLRLPLSELAASILRDRPKTSEYIFPSGRKSPRVSRTIGDPRPQLAALSTAAGIGLIRCHDLRRTFIRIGQECGIELWRLKGLANHKQKQGDVTLRSYTDLRDVRHLRPEVNQIADYLEQAAAKVVNLADRRAQHGR